MELGIVRSGGALRITPQTCCRSRVLSHRVVWEVKSRSFSKIGVPDFEHMKTDLWRMAATPAALFFAYLGLFGTFSILLGNDAAFRPDFDIVLSSDLQALVAMRLAIAKWGVSLVIFTAIGIVLAMYAGRFAALTLLPTSYSEQRKARAGLLWGFALTAMMFGALLCAPVSGGLQGYLYKILGCSGKSTLLHINGVMTLITTVTLVPSLAVSLALTALCLVDGKPTIEQVKRYRTLMALTAAFLCVGIVQVFLQYNWLTALVTDTEIAHDIRSSMTLASSTVYTGLFLSQFLSAAALIHLSAREQGLASERAGAEETLLRTMLGDGYKEKVRTAIILLSPLITGLFADLPDFFS